MRRTGRGCLPSRRVSPRLLLPLGLVFLLSVASCSGSLSAENVVDLYLSDVNQGDKADALKRWELSQIGPSLVALDPEQERVRLEGRRDTSMELTEALVMAGQHLKWEQEGASYYYLQNEITVVEDDDKNATLATIEMRLIVERNEGAALEESIAFNLWKAPDEGWRITGLDKGLSMLEPFLENLRDLQ